MKFALLISVLFAGLTGSAAAQTTQPAPAIWDHVVQDFSRTIVEPAEDGKMPDCKRNLADDCAIRGFDSSAKQIADLTAHTSGAAALMSRAYQFPGGCIAGDVGDAVQRSQVSDDVKKILVPPEGDSTNKANTTATHWIQTALAANDGDAIAVLVLFTGDVVHADSAQGQVLFVLLKGRKESSGTYLITQIVFGDTQQAAIASAR